MDDRRDLQYMRIFNSCVRGLKGHMELIRHGAIKIVTFFLIEFYPVQLILNYTPAAKAIPLSPETYEQPLANTCPPKQQENVLNFTDLDSGKEMLNVHIKY